MPLQVAASSFQPWAQPGGAVEPGRLRDAVVADKILAGRGHATPAEPGWQEVADYVLGWAEHPVPGDRP